MACIANGHYEMWGSACPATCTNPEPHRNCTKLCGILPVHQRASAQWWQVWTTWQVVSSTDSYYLPKENFWKDNECQEKCICQPNSRKVVCAHSPCQHSEVCRFLNGVRGCHRDSPIVCRTKGVLRYTTFDDRTHHVTGNCTYLLACFCTSWWSLEDWKS